MAKSRRRREAKSLAKQRLPSTDTTSGADFDDDDDGTLSTLSTLSEATLMAEHHHPPPNGTNTTAAFEEAVRGHAELLADRRSAVRRTASEALWRIFTRVFLSEDILQGTVETIVDGLVRFGIRKGGNVESKAACKTLAALWITIGSTVADPGWPRARDVLMKAGSPSAIECLCLGCFLFDEELEDVDRILSFLEVVIMESVKSQGEKIGEALRGWLLIATSLDSRQVVRRLADGPRDLKMALIRLATTAGSDPSARIAAVELLAYIVECGQHDSLNEDFSNERSRGFVNTIASALKEMKAKEESHHARVGKSDRQWRKELAQATAIDTHYMETVKASHTVLQATGIGELRRLDAFRSTLGGGLPAHVRDNPLVHDIFDVTAELYQSKDDQKASNHIQTAARRNRKRARNIELGKKRRSRWAQLEILSIGDSD